MAVLLELEGYVHQDAVAFDLQDCGSAGGNAAEAGTQIVERGDGLAVQGVDYVALLEIGFDAEGICGQGGDDYAGGFTQIGKVSSQLDVQFYAEDAEPGDQGFAGIGEIGDLIDVAAVFLDWDLKR